MNPKSVDLETEKLYVLIKGNVVDGLVFYGPFAKDELDDAAERVGIEDDIWVAARLFSGRPL